MLKMLRSVQINYIFQGDLRKFPKLLKYFFFIINVLSFVVNNEYLCYFFPQIVNGILEKCVHFDIFLHNFGIYKPPTKETEVIGQLRPEVSQC